MKERSLVGTQQGQLIQNRGLSRKSKGSTGDIEFKPKVLKGYPALEFPARETNFVTERNLFTERRI